MKELFGQISSYESSCSNNSAHEREMFEQISSYERSCSNSSAHERELFEQIGSFEKSCSNSSAHERELFEQLSSYERSCSNSSASIKRAFERLFRSAELNFRAGAGAPLIRRTPRSSLHLAYPPFGMIDSRRSVWPNGVRPFEHARKQTITLNGNFRFFFTASRLSASAPLTAHIWSFCELYTSSISIFSSENKIFLLSSFSKVSQNLSCKCFSINLLLFCYG